MRKEQERRLKKNKQTNKKRLFKKTKATRVRTKAPLWQVKPLRASSLFVGLILLIFLSLSSLLPRARPSRPRRPPRDCFPEASIACQAPLTPPSLVLLPSSSLRPVFPSSPFRIAFFPSSFRPRLHELYSTHLCHPLLLYSLASSASPASPCCVFFFLEAPGSGYWVLGSCSR